MVNCSFQVRSIITFGLTHWAPWLRRLRLWVALLGLGWVGVAWLASTHSCLTPDFSKLSSFISYSRVSLIC
jgi:hypothetical protein